MSENEPNSESLDEMLGNLEQMTTEELELVAALAKKEQQARKDLGTS